ncbi:LolA family protein [Paenibacillus sp. IHBB 10380]|uniref:LolA family protein n=1 Tax=Paenibacillus sp. IHBB 10380 TaxID=1566358 RepID=UPI0005CFCADE|nr:outer membrane lipoprotein carrier protein LolA [Paenibacillus sp. IHBB 10380]AJS59906.1 membrane protein [Paenibacillus sp. IHBB 10380]
MRRISWVLAVLLCVTVVLAGCGKKDASAVVKDLNDVSDKLESKTGSYQGSGTMTLYTGESPQQYQVEVWYQNPSYYRISLKNAQKNVTQIVLRNDDGVFVLTPSLNKSFRFQSDWPENQGQVYLYQTLLRGIIGDKTRQFADDKDSYVFEVAANYHSQSLVRQKIWLSKDNYEPKQVQVSDSEARVVVEVKFNEFAFDAKFDKDSFDMQHNMTALNTSSVGAIAEVDENGNVVVTEDEGTEGTKTEVVTKELGGFGTIIPGYIPAGVELKDENQVADSKDHSVLLRYDGTYQFTIIEARPVDRVTSLAPATGIDLGFTMGALTEGEQQTLTWMDNGIEFRITSANLPVSEMMQIAASLGEQSGK